KSTSPLTNLNTDTGERVNLFDLFPDVSLRIPGYFLYNPNARVRVEMDFSLSSGGGFLLELSGTSTNLNNVWGSIQIDPPNVGFGTVVIEATGAFDGSNGTFRAFCMSQGGNFVNIGTARINNSQSRNKDAVNRPMRLYATKTEDNTTLYI